MRNPRPIPLPLLLLPLALLACSLLAPTRAAPTADVVTRAPSTPPPSAQPSGQPTSVPSAAPTAGPSLEPTAQPSPSRAAASPTAIRAASPSPTAAPLQLEILQSQVWEDRNGNLRVNVLFRNPYDFPVSPGSGSSASALNSAGEFIRSRNLYFLDGISGGGGFLLPGETVAANACFTCETTPLPQPWASLDILVPIADATGSWDYATEVEAAVGEVSFDGDSPIFWITGTARNNSAVKLDRVSVRVVVYDQAGQLVGAAEASAWDVPPGASASVNSYGIGQAPAGPVTYEVTALGVNY
jgi:hypothetical protein